MARTTLDSWNPHCLTGPLFEPLTPLAHYLRSFQHHWPSLDDYQHILNSYRAPIQSKNAQPIRFVAQGESPENFEELYEPRIFLKGEVQTRLENWHDFFQVLIWSSFPKTKIELNARHYVAASQRRNDSQTKGNRSTIENVITLFDECGAIIISSNPILLSKIKEHRWKELFYHHRETIRSELKCIVFGHALYEKALTPYIGMTAHCLTLTVQQSQLTLPYKQLITYCDDQISQRFSLDSGDIQSTKDLSPFPLLGMPGWHSENGNENFYNNQQYFRPKSNPAQRG